MVSKYCECKDITRYHRGKGRRWCPKCGKAPVPVVAKETPWADNAMDYWYNRDNDIGYDGGS